MMSILMVGLDDAGKTTILYKLKTGDIVTTIPTFGYNDEIVEHRNERLMIYDSGGMSTLRPLWRLLYDDKDIQGLIFVVDSSNRTRIAEAEKELANMLKVDESGDIVILVFANKQDKPDALSTNELIDALNLSNLSTHHWYIQGTSTINGHGLNEGLDWLVKELAKRSVCNANTQSTHPASI